MDKVRVFFKRVINIFIYPDKVFNENNKSRKVLVIFVLVVVAQCLLLSIRYDLFSEYAKKKVEIGVEIYYQQEGAYELDNNTIQEVIKKAPKTMLKSVIITEIITLLMCTLYMYFANKLQKGKGNLYQYLYVITYSYMPMLLLYILTIVLSFFTNTLEIEIPLTSIAAFLPSNINSVVKSIFIKFELFSIWRLILLYIGCRTISKIESKKEIIIVVILWLFNVMISVFNGWLTEMYF